MDLTILRTDSVLPQFQLAFGDYPGMFEAVLQDAAGDLGITLRIESFDAREGLPSEQLHASTDAYLITGSRHSVYDDLPWIGQLADFLGQALDDNKKIIGICFGHQLMAHFFGGRVAPADAGWGVGLHTGQVTERHAWMHTQTEELALLCSHKDQVAELPDDAQVYLSSSFCPIGGFTMSDQVITVQGHPEFTKPYSEALMNYRREQLGEDTYAQGVASLGGTLDARTAMAWMLNFAVD